MVCITQHKYELSFVHQGIRTYGTGIFQSGGREESEFSTLIIFALFISCERQIIIDSGVCGKRGSCPTRWRGGSQGIYFACPSHQSPERSPIMTQYVPSCEGSSLAARRLPESTTRNHLTILQSTFVHHIKQDIHGKLENKVNHINNI